MVFSKGSRVVRSSSQGEIGLFSRVIPIDSVDDFFERRKPTFPNRVKKPSNESKRPVFTVGSPERNEDLSDDKNEKKKQVGEGFLEFLQKCSLCKKALKDEVYMYGYLGAFCSLDCREDRMILDGFHEEMEKEAKEMAENYAMLKTKMKAADLLASRFKQSTN